MYWFGKNTNGTTDIDDLLTLCRQGRKKLPGFIATPSDAIIEVLHRLGRQWQPGGAYWSRAIAILCEELPFSRGMIEASLAIMPSLLDAEPLRQRLTVDLRDPAVLDDFVAVKNFGGRVRAFPLGLVLHVTSGNVFLGCIDSLIMGFLTKNISIVKVSSRNLGFPLLFAESLAAVDTEQILADKFALVAFPGGSRSLEDMLKGSVDGIMAWGGEAMIESYKASLPLAVKFIEYGPKISIQVVQRTALERLGYDQTGTLIAADISMWDQAACASPQNLFVEDGCNIPQLMKAIAAGLERFPYKRGQLSSDEEVEILKEKFRGRVNTLCEGGFDVSGRDYYLAHDPAPGLRPSSLNRTLIVKSYTDLTHLKGQLAPFRKFLQSCGYLLEPRTKDDVLGELGAAGVMRFAALGSMMKAPVGAPHDGRFSLAELVRFAPDETPTEILDFVNEVIATVPFYHRQRRGKAVASLDEMPFLTAEDLRAEPLHRSTAFLGDHIDGGYVFSSSGTMGEPKFTYYSREEFSTIARMLAKGLKMQGLKAGQTVANLFVAGNLWSSFLAVDQALTTLGARVLPIGGLANPELILEYLTLFKPDAVFGLPTLLIDLAERSKQENLHLHIPAIFYAGEHFSPVGRERVRQAWGAERIASAGYASVDAGPIGYQCAHCQDKEHHLHADQVHLEVVDDEAVITSKVKKAMPVIRLRTGDMVTLLPGEVCACGSTDPKFKLLGRLDNQINIWGCRIFASDVEKALLDNGCGTGTMQVILEPEKNGGQETMRILVEGAELQPSQVEDIIVSIYEYSKDLKSTHPLSWYAEQVIVSGVPPRAIVRNGRTGKVKRLIDQRY